MIHVHSLRLFRVPDLLRNNLAQARVDLQIAEFQFLVDVIQVLVVQNDENMPFGEYTLLKLVIELFVSCA